jgi:hypothetical protein
VPDTELSAIRLITFDAATQTFRIFDRNLPAQLNPLREVLHGDALWVLADRSAIVNISGDSPKRCRSCNLPMPRT